MKRMRTALGRAIVLTIIVLAALPASSALAGTGVSILSPTSPFSSTSTAPTFSGTANETLNVLTLAIYAGPTASGTALQEPTFTPALGGESWTLTPAALEAGTYTAVARQVGELGELQESAEVIFTVEAAPAIETNPVSATVTAGETATFTAAASGTPTPSVQWQVSSDHGSTWTADTSDAGSTSDTLTVAAVTLAESGDEYRAMFSNSAGSQESEAATLTVQTPPVVTLNPQSETLTAGETATFKAAASGVPTPTVQWQVSSNHGSTWTDDILDAGSTSDTLTVSTVSLAQSGDEYRALFTNAVSSQASEAATLTVHTAPVVTLNPQDATVTAGETATFKAAASGVPTPTVQWQLSSNHGSTWTADTSDAGSTSDTLTMAAVTLAQSGDEYRAVFTNAVSSQASEAATLTVHTAPVVTLNPQSVTLTAGETATFTASASGVPTPTVQWQVSSNHGSSWAADTGDAGNKTGTLTVASVTLAQSGDEYRALFTNASGSQASEAATLTVQTAPVVTLNPQSETVTAGETATFKAAASGAPAPTVQWQLSSNHGSTWTADTSDAGNTSDTLTVAAVTLAESGDEYRAVFTNAVSSQASEAATLTVQTAPMVTLNPQSVTLTAGETATFTASASGVPTPTVQWQVSSNHGSTWTADTGDAGNKSGTLTVASVTLAESGDEYRALFTNGAGSQASEAATLTVQTAPVVTLNPQSVTLTAGETATFKAAASGVPAPTVQWQVSSNHGSSWVADTGDAGNKTGTLKVASVTLALSGNEYRAVFSNGAGSQASEAATLTVQTAPVVTLNPQSATLTEGESATFKAAASGTPAPTVQWQVSSNHGSTWTADTGDAGNKSGTLTVASVTLAESGDEYRALFTNGAGSQASEAATLTVQVPPVVTLNPQSATVTEGETATFKAAASGTPAPTVQWEVSKDHGSSWVTDTEDTGNKTDALKVASVTLALSGDEYRALFTNGAGSQTSKPATLTVQSVPTVTTNPHSTTATAGEAATFTAAASGVPTPTVQWQVSSNHGTSWASDTSDAGNTSDTLTVAAVTLAESGQEYRAVFTNAAGSRVSSEATLTVQTIPTVTASPQSATVTEGESATFTAAASGTPTPTVQWQVSTDDGVSWAADTADAGNKTDTLTVASATLSLSGDEYRAVFTNPAGSQASEPATLTVQAPPVITLNPQSETVIEGETAIFTAAASGVPAPTVQWQVSSDHGSSWAPDTEDAGNKSDTLSIAATLAQSGREYRAVFTNVLESRASKAATLTVHVPPRVTLNPSSATVTVGETVTFTAAATGTPTPSVQWEVSSDNGASWAPDTEDAGNTTDTLTVATVTYAQSGDEYRALFTNVAGSQASAPATLTVPTPPKVTASPENTTAFAGDTATFTATASGVPAPSVQWEVSSDFGSKWAPDTSDAGNTSGTLSIVATLAKNGYEYRAVFTNELGTVTSASAILLVQPAPPPPPPPAAAAAAPDAPPAASFVWLPHSPHVGEQISLVSNSTDASSPISGFAWDPKGNGPLLAGGPVLATSFATAGAHPVRLQVTAADGLSSLVTETIKVSARELTLMAPFPIVRLAGSYSASGVKISLLTVQAPAGAHITVSCRGRGCPRHSETRLAASSSTHSTGVVQLGFRHFERGLSPGAVLTVRIYKAGEIGKYTSFTVRRAKLPVRVDTCLDPTGAEPMTCPT